jgi:hypothetical protein
MTRKIFKLGTVSERAVKIALWIWISLLTLAFSWHFSLTFLFNMPLNPLHLKLSPLFALEFVPLFEQNWRFFAPRPINTNWALMVKCKAHKTGEDMTEETEWVDVSESYLMHHQQYRGISPRSRVVKLVTNSILAYMFGDVNVAMIRERVCRDEKKAEEPLCKREDAVTQLRRTQAEILLAHVASSACDWIVGPAKSDEVRVRIAIHRFPRFSERHLPDSEGTVGYMDLDWVPYQKVAAVR